MQIRSSNVSDIAEAFLKTEQATYKVVNENMYRYDPTTGVWRVMTPEALKARVQTYDCAFEIVVPTKKGSYLEPIYLEPFVRDKVADFLMHKETLRDDRWFETSTRGLAVLNGFVTISMDGATLVPHSPDHRARSRVAINFDPAVKAPKWANTLREAMREVVEGDENPAAADNKARLLQEFYGAARFGIAPNMQRCLIAEGTGNNGKSTILSLLEEIGFDPSDRTSTAPQMWEKEYYAAQLHDKLLNSVGELPAREIMTSSVFKQVVSGETTQGRHPRGKPFEFRPIAAHIFACNQLPSTGDYTEGYWRRFLVVRFKRRFDLVGETKGALTAADVKAPILAEEKSGVLNWMIEGAVRVLKNNGYTIPEQHFEALTEWRTEADPVLAWADSALMVDDEKSTPFADLYAAFCEWANATGHKQLASISLGRRLLAIKGAKATRRATGKLWNITIKPRNSWTNVAKSVNLPTLVSLPKAESING